tara:strand:+ start:87 stop:404 length:318 start_codon:yes stop_codon:yes gene_type:complete
MTVTNAPAVKNQELVASGLLESASVNSITDFTISKSNECKIIEGKGKENFVHIFICHLVFYVVFCLTIVLHILIDLGLGSFIKTNFDHLVGFGKKIVFEKTPSFA